MELYVIMYQPNQVDTFHFELILMAALRGFGHSSSYLFVCFLLFVVDFSVMCNRVTVA